MGQLTIKTNKEILTRMRNRCVARTDLTDLTRTSSYNQVLAAAAREDDEQWFQMGKLQDLFDLDKVSGTDLDERAKELNPELIERKPPIAATGAVVFSVSTAVVGSDVTIPIGTEVQVPGSGAVAPIKYTTTEEGTILIGNTESNEVDIVCQQTGTIGNADPDTITGFGSKPSGVDAVTNPNKLTTGQDKESDDKFRNRIKRFMLSLSRATIPALQYAAYLGEDTVTGKVVQYASVQEDLVNLGRVTVYIDDGEGTAGDDTDSDTGEVVIASASGGETVFYLDHWPVKTEAAFTIYLDPLGGGSPAALTLGTDYAINPANGKIRLLPDEFPDGLTATDEITADYTWWEGLIANTQKHIDGDANDRENYPGYRAAGVLVRVLSPSIVQMTFTANITVLDGYSQTTVASAVSVAIQEYINTLGIGEDVIHEQLSRRAMNIAGMYNINITIPSEDRAITEGQLARILAANINIT
jgi:uncharacterized phage protein gp47/JayE